MGFPAEGELLRNHSQGDTENGAVGSDQGKKDSECDALKKDIESLKQRIVDLTTLECQIMDTKAGDD